MADLSHCVLCRVMRGIAFGGLGAAIGGYGSLLFGALALTAVLTRKRTRKGDDR